MLKRRLSIVLLALTLVMGACTASAPSGLLSGNEVSKYESLYLTGNEHVLEQLGFTNDDLDTGVKDYDFWQEAGAFPMKEPRNMGGTDFQQLVLTSITEPEGLYGVRFSAKFMEKTEAQEAVKAIYEQAVELYGEPTSDGASPSYLSSQLEDPESGFETWEAGRFTEMRLSLSDATEYANFSPDWDFRYTVEVEYRVPRIVDGKLLSPDEILERVRSIQQE